MVFHRRPSFLLTNIGGEDMEIKRLPGIINNKELLSHTDIVMKSEIHRENQKPLEANSNITAEKLIDHINQMNDFIKPTKTNLRFQLHDKLNEYYVQVVDTYTDEVIREIPSKKFLDMYAATAELLGMLVDKKI